MWRKARDLVLMVVVRVKRAIEPSSGQQRSRRSKGIKKVKSRSKRDVFELSNVLGLV